MGSVCREARLLFILLWTVVDDDGRTRAASRMLASLLFPYDEDQAKLPKLIDGWLEELEGRSCLVRYRVDGNTYLEICNFRKHQKIDKYTASKLPAPPAGDMSPSDPDVSPTDLGRDQDQEKDQEEDHGALVERVFEHYCRKLERSPTAYTLTRDRKARAVTRIRERLRVHNGDIQQVKRELAMAIENLAASEYHVSQGYIDWTAQIFKSAEEFEKRINWKRPEAGNQHNRPRTKSEQALDELAKAGVDVSPGRTEAGPWESEPPSGGSDGRSSPRVVLEGAR